MSPSWRVKEYHLSFSSRDRGEPAHVHVQSENGHAKLWLDPVRLEWSSGYNERELRKIQRLVEDNREWLLDEWAQFWQAH